MNSMQPIWFDGYGLLDYLDPKIFYTSDWMWSTEKEGQDGNCYDIVFNRARFEYRYTHV